MELDCVSALDVPEGERSGLLMRITALVSVRAIFAKQNTKNAEQENYR
jgi:hypothetical protein